MIVSTLRAAPLNDMSGSLSRSSPAQQGFTPGRVVRGFFRRAGLVHGRMVRLTLVNHAPLGIGGEAPRSRGWVQSHMERLQHELQAG